MKVYGNANLEAQGIFDLARTVTSCAAYVIGAAIRTFSARGDEKHEIDEDVRARVSLREMPRLAVLAWASRHGDFLCGSSYEDASAAIMVSIAADVRKVRPDINTVSISDEPLWPEDQPKWAQIHWHELQECLPKTGGWDAWIGWYEDRLAGRSYSESEEIIFARAPKKLWKRDASEANAYLFNGLNKLH
jgi:hypothetical protein